MEEPTMDARVYVEISEARHLFQRYGNRLLSDPCVSRLLKQYRDAIAKTTRMMREMGMQGECARCAADGPGSCCFSGIEEGYDQILLLINLLMGCNIPDTREIAGSCTFLGPSGCKLRARYYYCVHFLCPRLHRAMDPLSVKELLRAVGEELHAGWEAEQAVRTSLKRREAMDGNLRSAASEAGSRTMEELYMPTEDP